MLRLKPISLSLNDYLDSVKDYLTSIDIKTRINNLKKELKKLENMKSSNNSVEVEKEINQKKEEIELFNRFSLIANKEPLIEDIKKLILFNRFENKDKVKENSFEELQDIYKIFKWKEFRSKKEVINVLKDIVKELEIKVCPYCGRNYIDSIEVDDYFDEEYDSNNKENKKKIIVPCIDHFYAKGAKDSKEKEEKYCKKKAKSKSFYTCNSISNNNDNYIQYSLSIYNLIPSCYLCNSQLKHDKDVADSKYQILYPYKEGFEDYVKFNLGDNSEEDLMKVVMLLTGDSNVDIKNLNIRLVKDFVKIKKDKCWGASSARKDSYDLNIDCNNNTNKIIHNNHDPINDFIEKCKNSNKMFHIEEIYNSEHKQNALDLLNRIVWYRKNYIMSLSSILPILDDFREQSKYCSTINNLVAFVSFQNKAIFKLKNELKNQMNFWIATQSTTARNDGSSQKVSSNIDNEIIKSKLDEFITNINLNDFLGDNFEFLFGRWLDPENDLKEPLSKFYRDIYKQITEPHLYELL